MNNKTIALSVKLQIAAIQRDRTLLLEQIRQSQLTIEKSRELLKRMDEMIARAEKKA